MICPRCQTLLSDDVLICDNCDFIIDTKFLGDNITNDPSTAPAQSDQTRIRAVNVDVPVRRDASETTPVPRQAADEPSGPKGPSAFSRIAAPPSGVNQTFEELRDTFKEFPASERFATGAAVAFLVSLGLPWRWTETDDSVIGFFAGPGVWGLGVLAAAIAVGSYLRREAPFRRHAEEILVGTLAASVLAVSGTVVFFAGAFERGTRYMAGKAPVEEWKAMPEPGAYVALAAGVIMLVATAITYFGPRQTSQA